MSVSVWWGECVCMHTVRAVGRGCVHTQQKEVCMRVSARVAGEASERSAGLGPGPLACTGAPGSRVSLALAAELEFVEITIIVLVVMVMVVVITCLLSHYKLSARSLIGRHSQGRRRDDALSAVSAQRPCSGRSPEREAGGQWPRGEGKAAGQATEEGVRGTGRGPKGSGGAEGAHGPAALTQTEGRWPCLPHPAGVWAWGQRITGKRPLPAPPVLAVRPRTVSIHKVGLPFTCGTDGHAALQRSRGLAQSSRRAPPARTMKTFPFTPSLVRPSATHSPTHCSCICCTDTC